MLSVLAARFDSKEGSDSIQTGSLAPSSQAGLHACSNAPCMLSAVLLSIGYCNSTVTVRTSFIEASSILLRTVHVVVDVDDDAKVAGLVYCT